MRQFLHFPAKNVEKFSEVWYNIMVLDVKGLEFDILNEKLRECEGSVTLKGCLGQRFIASGMKKKKSPSRVSPATLSALILTALP